MATVQKANKFFATHEPAGHQGPECIHFAAFVPRSLSLADAQELINVLTELLAKPKAPAPLLDPVERTDWLYQNQGKTDADFAAYKAAQSKPVSSVEKPEWELVDGKWQLKK